MLNKIVTVALLFTFAGSYAQQQKSLIENQVVLQCGVKGNLYGSFVLPEGDSVNTIVLIVGSGGAVDRDGNQRMLRNNAYRLLAVNLAFKNIASLRFDKRGVGASRSSSYNESDMEIETYVEDVKSWVNYLRRDGRFKNIILLGHGEGGLISSAAIADGAKVGGLITIGSMGRSFDQVLKDQLSEEPYYVRNISNNIIDSLKDGKSVSFVPFYLTSMFRHEIQPFIRSVMKYDPQKLIRKVEVPTVIIQGDTDIFAKVEDARLLHAANHNSRLVIIVGMNSVMKNCASVNRDEQMLTMVNPTLPINKNLIDVIIGFVNQIN